MKKTLLIEAIRLARAKVKRHPNLLRGQYYHYTFIVQDNKIVETGVNRNYAKAPAFYNYADHEYERTLHSEVDAYKKARGLLEKDSFEAINIRVNKQGTLRQSEPCPFCKCYLKTMGCRHVYFSTNTDIARISL